METPSDKKPDPATLRQAKWREISTSIGVRQSELLICSGALPVDVIVQLCHPGKDEQAVAGHRVRLINGPTNRLRLFRGKRRIVGVHLKKDCSHLSLGFQYMHNNLQRLHSLLLHPSLGAVSEKLVGIVQRSNLFGNEMKLPNLAAKVEEIKPQ